MSAGGMHITEAVASDKSGSVRLIWFNQPYRAAALRARPIILYPVISALNHQRLSIINPSIELVSDFPLNTARIVPIYRETKGLRSYLIRRCISKIIKLIDEFPETLPEWLLKEEQANV